MEFYLEEYDVYLAPNAVKHKLYSDFQSLPAYIYCWGELFIIFWTWHPHLTNYKKDNYDAILVIAHWLMKMIYHKLIKTTINVADLAKIIINVVIRQHNFHKLIISNQGWIFFSKFWCLLCYFFDVKEKLSTTFSL